MPRYEKASNDGSLVPAQRLELILSPGSQPAVQVMLKAWKPTDLAFWAD